MEDEVVNSSSVVARLEGVIGVEALVVEEGGEGVVEGRSYCDLHKCCAQQIPTTHMRLSTRTPGKRAVTGMRQKDGPERQ